MKKIVYSLIALGTLIIASCTSDPCKDKTAATLCNGKGDLVSDGTNCNCRCTTGNAGTSCNLTVAGLYTASNDILGTSTPVTAYTSSISITGTTVLITKFKNGFFVNQAVGTISGDKITLNTDQQPDNDGYKLNGTGEISSTATQVSIKWSYSITGPNAGGTIVTDNFNGTWIK